LEDELLDLIYGVVADPSRWPDVLVGLADHLGAVGGMMVHLPSPGSRQPPIQILARLPEEPYALFREHYQWNPWMVAVSKVPPGKVVNADSLIERGAIRKTAFWTDVCIPSDQADVLNLPHKTLAQDGNGGIGFCLSASGTEGVEQRVRELQRLAPHLCRALDASLMVANHTTGPQQLAVILDRIPNAALLLDGRGRITQTNSAADALLRQADGVAFDRKGNLQLAAALVSERRALARVVKDALDVANGLGTALSEPVQIARPSGAAPPLMTAAPLPRPSFAFAELVPTARVLVVIVDPAAKSRATASAIQAAYGLTGAEARIALLLASGVTGAQMPAALGVTAATIKTHLRHCYEKTGTHSQAELTRLFTMFPPGD